jgi:asparagine synthase (glutamine-hydrolysing)
MCGIAVAVDWEGAEGAVRRLVRDIIHRGDVTDPVVSVGQKTAMCTRRLRIVDAANAVQPQLSSDGKILVSFNGQIYNHVELRRELEALGARFRTASDTEVLATALAIWGASALQRINGMYAFVAIDTATGQFLAARDPLGVKPLYFIQSGAGFLFCSEIRPLLLAVEAGNVMFLPPGYVFTRTQLRAYRTFTASPSGNLIEHDPQALDRLLATAVHRRIPPDLPFAVMFSGGIDSTMVLHYARQLQPTTPGYFLGGDKAPDYRFAASYADQTGLDFRCVSFDEDGNVDTLLSRIGEIVEATEAFEPDVIRGGLCTYLLARRIHQDGYRVALAGEGADELFAGYIPLELAFADSDLKGSFVRHQHIGAMHRSNLQRIDRCGMRFQVEVREPFLDPTMVDYAFNLRGSALVQNIDGHAKGKAPLRTLYDLYPQQLPISIRDRVKIPLNEGSGFDISYTNSSWRAFAEQAVSDREFADGRRRFAAFDLRTKEEFLYLNTLATVMDVFRIPHLTNRARLLLPAVLDMRRMSEYVV